MFDLDVQKEKEIERMVTILKQIDLPDILLLSRDANTLLLRQQEGAKTEASAEKDKREGMRSDE